MKPLGYNIECFVIECEGYMNLKPIISWDRYCTDSAGMMRIEDLPNKELKSVCYPESRVLIAMTVVNLTQALVVY